MSQALAIIEQNPGGALAAAYKGTMAPIEYSEDALAEPEERGDFSGIPVEVPRISANASQGRFHEAGLKEKAMIDESPKSITGVLLARVESNVHFVPKDGNLTLAANLGYDQSLLNAEKWICKNSNLAAPKEATLHPSLTPQQRQAAHKLGLGGATGKGCQGCPAAAWHSVPLSATESQNMRLCTHGENFIWLDSKLAYPVVLQISAKSSVGELRKWLASTFRRGDKVLALHSFVIRMSWTSATTKAGKEIWILKAEIVEPVASEFRGGMRQLRQDNIYLFDRVDQAQDYDGGDYATTAPAATPNPDFPPPSDEDYQAVNDALDGAL